MGQNRKVRKSRNKNKLKVQNEDLFEVSVAATLEKVEPKSPMFPNYDFKKEVERDANNEKWLLWAEIIVLLGIVIFVLFRNFFLSRF